VSRHLDRIRELGAVKPHDELVLRDNRDALRDAATAITLRRLLEKAKADVTRLEGQRDDVIEALADAGVSLRGIGRLTGVSDPGVRYILDHREAQGGQ
jgi:hypothetical protein